MPIDSFGNIDYNRRVVRPPDPWVEFMVTGRDMLEVAHDIISVAETFFKMDSEVGDMCLPISGITNLDNSCANVLARINDTKQIFDLMEEILRETVWQRTKERIEKVKVKEEPNVE